MADEVDSTRSAALLALKSSMEHMVAAGPRGQSVAAEQAKVLAIAGVGYALLAISEKMPDTPYFKSGKNDHGS